MYYKSEGHLVFLELFFLSIKILNTYLTNHQVPQPKIFNFVQNLFFVYFKLCDIKKIIYELFVLKIYPVYNIVLFTQRWSDVYDFFTCVPTLSIIVLALVYSTFLHYMLFYVPVCTLYCLQNFNTYCYLNANCLVPTAHHCILTKYILYGLPGNLTIL